MTRADKHQLSKRRWGWEITGYGPIFGKGWIKPSCLVDTPLTDGPFGPLLRMYRKHMYKASGPCRRCGMTRSSERSPG